MHSFNGAIYVRLLRIEGASRNRPYFFVGIQSVIILSFGQALTQILQILR